MNLDSVKIFCDVVRMKSFSRAARANNVSQSAASQAVLQIERRLGVRLIDRSRRPLTLTPEGRIYYNGCRDLISRYLWVEEQVRSLHQTASAKIGVASIYSVGLYDLNRIVQAFQATHPEVTIQIEYLHPEEVERRVLEDEADLGLLSMARPSREIEVIPWRDEPMVLVCEPAHWLARREMVQLDDLEGVPFVAFEAELAIRRYLDRALREASVTVREMMALDNIESMKRAVEAGSGVSILPLPTVRREVQAGTLVAVPIVGTPLVRSLAIIHRRKRNLSLAAGEFVSALRHADHPDDQPVPAPAPSGNTPQPPILSSTVVP